MQVFGDYQFNQWLESNRHTFVSHATYNDKVIGQRLLKCAEEVFRTEGSVEHEVGMMFQRKVSTSFNPGSNPYQGFIYHTGHVEEGAGYANCMVIPEFALNRNYIKMVESNGDAVEDKGDYVKVYSDEYIPVQGCAQYSSDILRSRTDLKDKTPEKTLYLCPNGYLKDEENGEQRYFVERQCYRSDEQAGRKVDRSLRAIYQDLTNEGLCPDRTAYILYSLRMKVFGTAHNRLSGDIRVDKNGVRWSYGDMAVLMGNPRVSLAWQGTFSEEKSNKSEFHLRQSFQVSPEEGFYKVRLDDPSIIVVCVEKKFEELRCNPNVDPQLKGRLINMSALTPEQKSILS